MQMNYQFDARQYDPTQGGPSIPPGKYQAQITKTEIKPTKDNDGGMFCVTFKTPVGEMVNRYNLWNQNAQAVDIAHRQLSALCHAINVYNVDMNNGGQAIVGAQLMIEVGLQKGEKEGGYTEIRKVYDAAGNEPGKAGTNQQAPQNNGFNQQPQQNGGGFNQQPQQQQQQQNNNVMPAAGSAWGQPQQNQQQPAQQQQPANGGGGAPAWGQNGPATQQAPQQQQAPAWGQQNQPQGNAPAQGGGAPWGQR